MNPTLSFTAAGFLWFRSEKPFKCWNGSALFVSSSWWPRSGQCSNIWERFYRGLKTHEERAAHQSVQPGRNLFECTSRQVTHQPLSRSFASHRHSPNTCSNTARASVNTCRTQRGTGGRVHVCRRFGALSGRTNAPCISSEIIYSWVTTAW